MEFKIKNTVPFTLTLPKNLIINLKNVQDLNEETYKLMKGIKKN